MNNGYLYVATVKHNYYRAAKLSAISLKEFYPEAKTCIFTLPEWVDDETFKIFDHVFTNPPNHVRAKLWALQYTPFKTTMYLDCDTYIEHEDISKAFDYLGDNDIIFTRNRPYNAKITKLSETEEMIYHCGVFVYDRNSRTKKLMSDWYLKYCEQIKPGYDPSPYSDRVRPWDTFTMWYLLNKTEHKKLIKVGDFPSPDARWNFVMGQRPSELEEQPKIITHYSIHKVFPNANPV